MSTLQATAVTLTVAGNSALTPIGIAAPTDDTFAAAQLTVTVTGLPDDGIIYRPDGVTPLNAGDTLTVAQLTGLLFAPSAGLFATTSMFTYRVTDPSGATANGNAVLQIAQDTLPPLTMVADVLVGENSQPVAINILAPTDPVYAGSQLSVRITGLPTNGAVYLADGTTVVNSGDILSATQLTGLLFQPSAGVVSQNSALTYTVTNPAGVSTSGSAALDVGPAPAGPDTLVLSVSGAADPRFLLFVNDTGNTIGSGVPAGGPFTVTADTRLGQSQTITITGDFNNAKTIDLDYFNNFDVNFLVVQSITFDGTPYLARYGELNENTYLDTNGNLFRSGDFTLGTGANFLFHNGTLRFVINDTLTTAASSLTVAAGNAPSPIGIAAPADGDYPPSQLVVTITGLPTDGTVYLADGITPLLPGQTLSVAQLTGLTFAGNSDAAGQSGELAYTVSNLTGTTASGTATLSVVANTAAPETTAVSLNVPENAAPAPIGIPAPTDANASYTSAELTATALGLPTDGTVFLADGVTRVRAGQQLTVSQLTGLEFAPAAGTAAESSQFTYTVTDPSGKSSLGTATLNVNPAGNILTVGAGKEFASIAAAIAAAQDGDTIQVAAGTYINDFPGAIFHNSTLEGVGGMVNMVATTELPSDKGILVTDANVTINNFSFSGALADPGDANGAGIRYESGNLNLNNDVFYNNQNGLLGAADVAGTITINNSEFANNGVSDPTSAGFGFTHNLYVGEVAQLTVNNSYFHAVNIGNEVKSRALNTTIETSRIQNEGAGTGSYDTDLPNGGNAIITNNIIEKGPLAQNPISISIGEEGNLNATASLLISGNIFLDDVSSSDLLGVVNATATNAQITGNAVYGLTSSQIATGPNTQSNTTILTSEPALDTASPWSMPAPSDIPCFCRGTMILTETGQVAVENLKLGDRVLTIGGEAKPIAWIGHGRRRVTGSNPEARPLIVRADAFAEGVPLRDLYLTRGHSLYLDEILVPVEFLVNERSILWDDSATEVTFYHIELQDHDVLLAEGAPAESYRDDGNRGQFDNSEPPRFAAANMLHFAPLMMGGPEVERIWREVLDRSGFVEPEATDDPDLHLVADGQRIEPHAVDSRRHGYQGIYRFHLHRAPKQLAIVSHSCVPMRMGLTHDPRRLGVALRSIALRGSGVETRVDYDSVLLSDGFDEPEPGPRHRWTNGRAALPRAASRVFDGAFELSLDVVCTSRYPVADACGETETRPVRQGDRFGSRRIAGGSNRF